MQSHVDQLSPILVEVKVEVPWAKVNENLEGAYRSLQRTAQVRGFRPGKVPRNIVKNLMGKSVEREVTSRLIEEALGEAVKTHALDPVSVSHMDSPAISEGQPWSFTAKLEVRPKIDEIDFSSLTASRTLDAVADADIDREIEQLRTQNAELVTPDPLRPAKNGDVLALDIDVSVEGQPRPDLSSKDSRAELGSERLLAEIEAGLQGATLGEKREVNLVFPEDYGHEPLRGKAALFQISVKELQEKVLPAVDDEFARDLEHESLAAMRESIRKRLEDTAQRKADAMVREQLVDKLVDANPVPVPPSLIERQQQAMMQELFQLQQMLGRQLPFDGEMQQEMLTRAERKIRAGLLFAAISDQHKVTVTDEEIEAKLKEIADQSGKHVAKVRADYAGERREQLHNQLLQNKLLEYLLSRATITESGAGEAAAESESAPATEPATSKKAKAAKPEEQDEAAKPKSKAKSAAKSEAKEAKAETAAPAKKKAAPKKAKTGDDEG
jgi:trigger factor